MGREALGREIGKLLNGPGEPPRTEPAVIGECFRCSRILVLGKEHTALAPRAVSNRALLLEAPREPRLSSSAGVCALSEKRLPFPSPYHLGSIRTPLLLGFGRSLSASLCRRHCSPRSKRPAFATRALLSRGCSGWNISRSGQAQAGGVACSRSHRQTCGDLGTAPLSFPHPSLWSLLETQAHPFPPRHVTVPRLMEKHLLSLLDLSSDTSVSVCGCGAVLQPACLLTAPQFPHGDPALCHCGQSWEVRPPPPQKREQPALLSTPSAPRAGDVIQARGARGSLQDLAPSVSDPGGTPGQ